MSQSNSDFYLSDGEDEGIIPQEQNISDGSDEDFSGDSSLEDEDDMGAFFDGEQDPLAFMQGLEDSHRAPYQLLRKKNRPISKAAGDVSMGEDDDMMRKDEEEEEEEDEEEEEEEEEENGPNLNTGGDLTGGDAMLDEDDVEFNIKDEFNEKLAEQFGLAPPVSRKKARNREKYRRRNPRKRRGNLPEEAARKLGEANLLYSAGNHSEAITVLQEVIRLAPNSGDAYHTLGSIYDDAGDTRRALNFFMLAAHLTPKQVDLWRRLANMSLKQGMPRQAVYCFTQVIKRDRDDVEARCDRAYLLASLGHRRQAIEALESVRAARPDLPEVAKQLARMYYHTGQFDKASDVLKDYWSSFPEITDLTHINLLAELLCSPEISAWQEVFDVLERAKQQFMQPGEDMPIELEVKAALATARLGDIDTAETMLQPLFDQPVSMFDDLYIAAADCFEALGLDDKAEPFLVALAEDPASSRAALWQRLAECRRRMHGPQAAADVWKNYSQDLDPNHADFMDSIVSLADALKSAGDDLGAAQALKRLGGELPVGSVALESYSATEEDLIQRASILKACGRTDLFVSLTLPSLQATLATITQSDRGGDGRLTGLITRSKSKSKIGRRSAQEMEGQIPTEDGVFVGYAYRRRLVPPRTSEGNEVTNDGYNDDTNNSNKQQQYIAPSMEVELDNGVVLSAPILPNLLKSEAPFQLLVDSILYLIDLGRPSEARRLAENTVDIFAKKAHNRLKRDTMRLLAAKAALAEGDLGSSLRWLKSPANRWNSSAAPWNIFSQLQIAAGGVRQSGKFLTPMRNRNPSSLPLALMLGHAYLQSASYESALSEYFQAYRLAPDEPLVLLCIAIALVNHAVSRNIPDRHATVLQAFTFMHEYSKRRRDSIEAAYNAGRAAQHFSLNSLAASLYQQAIDASSTCASNPKSGHPPTMERKQEDINTSTATTTTATTTKNAGAVALGADNDAGNGEQYHVVLEAAFNLSLIYKASGATSLAKQILKDHLTF